MRNDPRTEGRCIQGCHAERICDLRVSATFVLYHNCDAPRIVPRRLRLHVWWSGHTIKGAAANTRLEHGAPVYGTMPAATERGMLLPSVSVMDHDRSTDHLDANPFKAQTELKELGHNIIHSEWPFLYQGRIGSPCPR